MFKACADLAAVSKTAHLNLNLHVPVCPSIRLRCCTTTPPLSKSLLTKSWAAMQSVLLGPRRSVHAAASQHGDRLEQGTQQAHPPFWSTRQSYGFGRPRSQKALLERGSKPMLERRSVCYSYNAKCEYRSHPTDAKAEQSHPL